LGEGVLVVKKKEINKEEAPHRAVTMLSGGSFDWLFSSNFLPVVPKDVMKLLQTWITSLDYERAGINWKLLIVEPFVTDIIHKEQVAIK
jgi:hypothetical protein